MSRLIFSVLLFLLIISLPFALIYLLPNPQQSRIIEEISPSPLPTTSISDEPSENIIHTGKGISDGDAAIELVKKYYPEVAKIEETQEIIGKTMNITVKETQGNNGWRILFWQGWGDCPAGCINNQQWYFTVTRAGEITKVGESVRIYNPAKNAIDESGVYLPNFLED